DVIAQADEQLPGQPLLEAVMQNGERLAAGRVDLESARTHANRQTARLPNHVRAITPAEPPYPVEVSRELTRNQKEIEDQVKTM
ncbi:MAG: hypothetical protein R6V33_11975, partial [Pelovirga sp.]